MLLDKLKLTKKDFRKYTGWGRPEPPDIYLAVNNTYVSNGHWALRRTCLANAEQFASLETIKIAFEISDWGACRVFPHATIAKLANVKDDELPMVWSITPWNFQLKDFKGEQYRLIAGPCGILAALHERYVTLLRFGVGDTLWSWGEKAALLDAADPAEADRLIMPAIVDIPAFPPRAFDAVPVPSSEATSTETAT